MKKIFAPIMGFTPLLLGYGLNLKAMNVGTDAALIFDTFTIMFFLYWGLLGFVLSKFIRSKVSTLVLCHLPALLVLLLILFQEIINKQYWNNNIGFATQFFYLPTIRASFIITGFLSMHRMWETYIVSFVLMIAVFYLGGYSSREANRAKVNNLY